MKKFFIIIAILGLCFLSVNYFSPNAKDERNQQMNEKLDSEYEKMMTQLGSTMVSMDGKKGQENYEQVEEVLSGLMSNMKK